MDKPTFETNLLNAINTLDGILLKTHYKISRDILYEIKSDIVYIKRRAEQCEITDIARTIRRIVKLTSAYENIELSTGMDFYFGEISENIKTLEQVIHRIINAASLFIKHNCIIPEKREHISPPV